MGQNRLLFIHGEKGSCDNAFNEMFISQLYLNVKPAIIIIKRILHKNVFKFQVPVYYICEKENWRWTGNFF